MPFWLAVALTEHGEWLGAAGRPVVIESRDWARPDTIFDQLEARHAGAGRCRGDADGRRRHCQGAFSDREHIARGQHDPVFAARLDEPAGELLRVEARVLAAARDELGMRPLDQPPGLDHEDHVRGKDRRETVRDRGSSSAFHHGLEGGLDEPLATGVEREVASSRISTGGFFSTTGRSRAAASPRPDMR